jgi:hypothetical protein
MYLTVAHLKSFPVSLRKLQAGFCGLGLALGLGCLTSSLCPAQEHNVLCSDGSGSLHADFRTGVGLQVGAARTGELAARTCQATLSWRQGSLIVSAHAPEIDVDAFGVDLGLGEPVAALQVRKSRNECCMEYQIYSLETPPRLLRTIAGGDHFSAADTDLDGRIEIWTHDAAAVEGFEHLSPGEFDSAPTVVLRFSHGELQDASGEFVSHFDHEIERLRKELDDEGLREFKNTDGQLSASVAGSAERMHRLRGVKAKVLEIVWAYLYSGREQQAWRVLAEMWPTADVTRIRAAIQSAHARGITAGINRTSSAGPANRKRAPIFDAMDESGSGKLEITPPVSILLRRPAPGESPNENPTQSESLLELVIDSAGKVRSAKAVGKSQPADAALIQAASGWKFIPAFRAGRPVASRMRLAVSLRQ